MMSYSALVNSFNTFSTVICSVILAGVIVLEKILFWYVYFYALMEKLHAKVLGHFFLNFFSKFFDMAANLLMLAYLSLISTIASLWLRSSSRILTSNSMESRNSSAKGSGSGMDIAEVTEFDMHCKDTVERSGSIKLAMLSKSSSPISLILEN